MKLKFILSVLSITSILSGSIVISCTKNNNQKVLKNIKEITQKDLDNYVKNSEISLKDVEISTVFVENIFNLKTTENELFSKLNFKKINDPKFNNVNISPIYSLVSIDNQNGILKFSVTVKYNGMISVFIKELSGFKKKSKISQNVTKKEFEEAFLNLSITLKDNNKLKEEVQNIFTQGMNSDSLKSLINLNLNNSNSKINNQDVKTVIAVKNINTLSGSLVLSVIIKYNNFEIELRRVINGFYVKPTEDPNAKLLKDSVTILKSGTWILNFSKANTTYARNFLKTNYNQQQLKQIFSNSNYDALNSKVILLFNASENNYDIDFHVSLKINGTHFQENISHTFNQFKHPATVETLRNSADTKYNLSTNQVAIDNLKLKIYSASLNRHNYQTYLQISNTDIYDYEFKNIAIDPNNINKTILTFNLYNEDHSQKITMTKTFNSTLDLNNLIKSINKTQLEDVFTLTNNFRRKYNPQDLSIDILKQNLTSKRIRYFTFLPKSIENSTVFVEVYVENTKVSTIQIPLGNFNKINADLDFSIGLKRNVIHESSRYQETFSNEINSSGQPIPDGIYHSNLTRVQYMYADNIRKAMRDHHFDSINLDFTKYMNTGYTKYERLFKSFNGDYSNYKNLNSNNFSSFSTLTEENFNLIRNIALQNIFEYNNTIKTTVVLHNGFFDFQISTRPKYIILGGRKIKSGTITELFNTSKENELTAKFKIRNEQNQENYQSFTFKWDTRPISKNDLNLINMINDNPHSFLINKNEEAQSKFLPSQAQIWEIFNTKDLPNHYLKVVPHKENNPGYKNYNDTEGSYIYDYEIISKKTNKVIYIAKGVDGSGFKLNYFKKAQDPNYKSEFTDSYFETSNTDSTNLLKKVSKINGSNFELILTNKFSYLDPDYVNNFNIKYFLKFKGATQSGSTDPNFKLDNNTSNSGPSVSSQNSNTTTGSNNNISNDPSSGIDINKLLENHFFVYYDVQRLSVFSIRFKIGFINKNNSSIKSHTNFITLINLENKLQTQKLIKQDVNNIAFSHLSFNNLSTISAQEFKNFNEEQRSGYINVNKSNEFEFKHYASSGNIITDFVVADVIVDSLNEGAVFINFQYVGSRLNRSTDFKSQNWIRISGFKKILSSQTKLSDTEKFYKLFNIKTETGSVDNVGAAKFATSNMNKTQMSSNKIIRFRKLELLKNDNRWILNDAKTSATNILLAKYYKPLLETNSVYGERYISVRINALLNNKFDLPFNRINKNYIRFQINYDLLKNSIKPIEFTGNLTGFKNSNQPELSLKYIVKVELVKEGIKLTFLTNKSDYKITQNYMQDVHFNFQTQNPNLLGILDKNKAIYLDEFATSFDVFYQNNIENENFISYKSNIFDYENVTFTQENQPILIKGQPDNVDPFIFNPNQNLDYKWTQGYKLNMEYIHESADFKAFNDIKARTFAGSFGSMTMIRRIGGNRYFVATNNHVQDEQRNPLDEVPLQSFHNVRITRHSNNFSNLYFNGNSYWSGENTANLAMKEFWDGKDQQFANSNGKKNVDYAIMEVDLTKTYQQLIKDGNFTMYHWLKNWENLKNLNINYDNRSFSPFQKGLMFNYAFSGFPYAKQSSYLYRRINFSDANLGFSADKINPIYHNAGNSGTGVISNDGQYIGAINSGSPLKLLVAWKLVNSFADYWGKSEEDKKAINKKNNVSFAATYLRANLYDPIAYPLPEEFK